MGRPEPLVIYGDFNCPFSALASARAAVLEESGRAAVDWRAIRHLDRLPPEGRPVEGRLRTALAEEIEQVVGLCTQGERFTIQVPPVQPDTTLATGLLAATPAPQRRPVRLRLFEAYWVEGYDIGHRAVLEGLGFEPPAGSPPLADRWQSSWSALGEPVIPSMVLADGYVSHGLGTLERLAERTREP